ncbi:MAG TPA: MarR family transcriptional regulator [Jatrophihabitans sp.]|nr:MarR family transcriptional regulator [Jatrophihabitans sp.]
MAVHPSSQQDDSLLAEQVDAILLASRALVALSAESLASIEDVVTLTQLRLLMNLSSRGGMSITELSEAARITPSAASRACDKLVGYELVTRRQSRLNRRTVTVELTPRGHRLVESIARRRRAAAEEILHRIPLRERALLVPLLRRFAAAGGVRPGSVSAGDGLWPPA